MTRVNGEMETHSETQRLLQIQQTNAKLQQLKLYYEIKKLEDEHGGIPMDKTVEKLIRFDIDLPLP
jgi:hypothetical protein